MAKQKLEDIQVVQDVAARSPEIVVAVAVGWLQRMLEQIEAQSRVTANMVETLVKSSMIDRNERH